MFTAKPQKNRTNAALYFDEHLSHNDYYSEQQTQAGQWIGEGAAKLGLKRDSSVARDAFLRLCDNQHPDTAEQLTPLRLKERRLFFDFTCSAPKSVSILAIALGDVRLREAHREAAAFALRELERFAGARVRKRGAMEDRTTGNLIAAAFEHTTSRALDPQLHTHFTVFNVTFDAEEGRWKALQTSGMFAAIRFGTAVYRNELAKRIRGLGYSLRVTTHGFEVEGVNRAIIERFSKRAKQVQVLVANQERKLGRQLIEDEVSHLVHQSRPKKDRLKTDEEVRTGHLAELGFLERRSLRRLVESADGTSLKPIEQLSENEIIDFALAHVFARKSVANDHEILEAALIKGCGQIELQRLRETIAADSKLVQVGEEFSTREILTTELHLIRSVNRSLGQLPPMATSASLADHLGSDQREALKEVLESRDRYQGMRGLAGTGKTTALKEFNRAIEERGLRAAYCAPTAAAADVLRRDGFTEAMTLARLLDSATLPQGAVVVVDEAGLVGVSDLKRLFDLVEQCHGRAVLVGDTGQHGPVPRGDALRLLENFSGFRYGQLTDIRRQRRKEFRELVSLAANRQAEKAFRQMVAMDGVIAHEQSEDVHHAAAQTYIEGLGRSCDSLIVAPTWKEIEAITQKVRAGLKQSGILKNEDHLLSVFESLDWTEAERTLVDRYETGFRLRFVRPTKHFELGEIVEVASTQGRQLAVKRANGMVKSFKPQRGPGTFDVGVLKELPVASGDWLLLQANASGFINGERVRVNSVSKDGVQLEDGRQLPASYRTFTHGYAVTSQSAQGRTVDEVLVVATSQSFAAVSREQFYVSISRARERAALFTDDVEGFARCLESKRPRKSAVELLGLNRSELEAKLAPDSPRQSRSRSHQSRIATTLAKAWRRLHSQRLTIAARVRMAARHFQQRWRSRSAQHVSQRTNQTQTLQRSNRRTL